MSDEEVIKRRLLIDGDGTGDDRRLNVLLKSYLKWCNSQETTENNQSMHDRMLAQLAQCEFAMTKSDTSSKMMKQELKNYETISKAIESGTEHAKKQIELNKQNLILAKKIRKNRMEYDVLAKVIIQQPDRKKTTEQLEKLKNELKELEDNRKMLQRKFEVRKKDFTVLMQAINELQVKLSDDFEMDCTPEYTRFMETEVDFIIPSAYTWGCLASPSYPPTSPGKSPISQHYSSSPCYPPTTEELQSSPIYSPASPNYAPKTGES